MAVLIERRWQRFQWWAPLGAAHGLAALGYALHWWGIALLLTVADDPTQRHVHWVPAIKGMMRGGAAGVLAGLTLTAAWAVVTLAGGLRWPRTGAQRIGWVAGLSLVLQLVATWILALDWYLRTLVSIWLGVEDPAPPKIY
jgi:hypothetical protein